MISRIRAALEKRIAALDGFPTAWENVPFTPVAGVAYQRVSLMPMAAQTDALDMRTAREDGMLQILLCYPTGKGTGEAHARAETIRAHFSPGTDLIEAGQRVRIIRHPSVSTGFVEADRYVLPITVRYTSNV